MGLHKNAYARPFAKFVFIFALTAILPIQRGKSLMIHSDTDPPWIAQALANGDLDQITVYLMRRFVGCRQAGWAGALNWLESNSVSMETAPDFGNDVFKFKVARGALKDFPDVTITIRMRTWTATSMCGIEIEQYGHEQDAGLTAEQLIRNAKIFARFKTYMLATPDNNKH